MQRQMHNNHAFIQLKLTTLKGLQAHGRNLKLRHRNKSKVRRVLKVEHLKDEFKRKLHPQTSKTIVCRNHKDTSAEAASGAAWSVRLLRRGAASTKKLVQLVRVDIATAYSEQLCGYASRAVGVPTQGFSEVQRAHCKHPPQLTVRYPSCTEKLKTDCLSKDQRLLNYQVRNTCFLECSLAHSCSIHTAL